MRKILSGRNTLITGGNRGVGADLVRRYAMEGSNIIFNSSTPSPNAEKYAKEISKEYGVECIYTKCDINHASEIQDMVNLGKEKLGNIDILLNNAGKAYFGDTENLNMDEWDESVRINLTAPILFSKFVIPMMKKNQWGRIINFSSGSTIKPEANLGGYLNAKAGVNTLTKVMARELGDFNINVNCLIPGCIDTDMFNDGIVGLASSLGISPEDLTKQVLAGNHVIKTLIKPRLLSDFCVYLCSESGDGLTGGFWPIDHGYSC